MALGAEGILVSGEEAVATPPMTTKNQHGMKSPSQDNAPDTGKRAQDMIPKEIPAQTKREMQAKTESKQMPGLKI